MAKKYNSQETATKPVTYTRDSRKDPLGKIFEDTYTKLFGNPPTLKDVNDVKKVLSKDENVSKLSEEKKYFLELRKKMLTFWGSIRGWDFPDVGEEAIELKDHLNKMRILQYTHSVEEDKLEILKKLLLGINTYYNYESDKEKDKQKSKLINIINELFNYCHSKTNRFRDLTSFSIEAKENNKKHDANVERLLELMSNFRNKQTGQWNFKYNPFDIEEKNALELILHIKKFFINEERSGKISTSLNNMLSSTNSALIYFYNFNREIETYMNTMENNNFVINVNPVTGVYELRENPNKRKMHQYQFLGGRKIRSMRRRSPLNKTRRRYHGTSWRRHRRK